MTEAKTGLLMASPSNLGLGKPKLDLGSQVSLLSRLGVPFGVLLALSTRTCLEPERGVMLLLSCEAKGEGSVALTAVVCWVRWLAGVVAAKVGGFWVVLEAILGVKGFLFMALAAAALRDGICGLFVFACEGGGEDVS